MGNQKTMIAQNRQAKISMSNQKPWLPKAGKLKLAWVTKNHDCPKQAS